MNKFYAVIFGGLVSILFSSLASAQDDAHFRETLELSGKIDSAEVKKATAEFQSQLVTSYSDFETAMKRHRDGLSGKLEIARLNAMKSDQLDEAIKIRALKGEIDKLTPTDMLIDPAKLNETRATEADFSELAGTWKGTWGTTGNPIVLEINKRGIVATDVERLKLVNEGGRVLALGAKRSENLQLIHQGDRVYVLGWSVSRKQDPLVDQPAHVGIVRRDDAEPKQ